MSFVLKNQTTLATDSLPSASGGLSAGAWNFIDPYSYAMVYKPDQIMKIHLQKGKGKLMKFTNIVANAVVPFASDQVHHTELGDLHESFTGVTQSTDTFTTATAHGLRVGDNIMLSDGTVENQAVVTSITNTTVFVAKNKANAAWGMTGTVTLFKNSNTWGKGEGNFTQGREDTPEFFTNYPHIIKDFYSINESDMAHHTWVETPQFAGGTGWYNTEFDRTLDSYDNLIELTQLLNERAETGSDAVTAGYEKGMNGIVPTIEKYGNIGNENITDIEELSLVAQRIKQQGGSTDYSWWQDHAQLADFRKMLAGVNSHYSTGSNYGLFNNGKDMALSLGFKSVYIDGITFHASPLDVLDNPSMLGAQQFVNTSVGSLMIPMGEKSVLEDGNVYDRPYLTIRYRQKEGINRYRKVKIFGGPYGTPHKLDTMEMHVETEMTNQLVGANQWFVFRRGTGIYTGS